jgi:hypothetical protein
VIGLGTQGTNTPYSSTNQCIVAPDGTKPGFATIQYCGPADGNLGQQGEVFKLKYDFTPTTSLQAGFVGAWGEWNPQGTAWGQYYGPQTIEQCQTAASYQCTNPNNASLIGKTINGFGWYTGSSIYNNQTLFDGELRTALGNTTILIRPYLGSIEPEVILGAGQTSFPSFFGPPGSYSFPNGTTPPASFTATTPAEQACAGSYGNLTNPQGQYTVVNGQFECFGGAYTTYEQDKLYGTTTSIIQPFGDNLINLTYDFHGQSTYAYIDNPAGVSVPFSTDRYSTFSLTGVVKPTSFLGVNFGLYNTNWAVNGLQLANPANTTSTALAPLNRTVTSFDPHVALVFRPSNNSSIRVAWGTSTTFPFVGQVSGLATYETPAQSLGPPFAGGGTLTEKNPNLNPEHSIAYTLGGDVRLKNSQTVSLDLNQTVIHGVFEQLTSELILNTPNTINPGTPTIEGIFFPANVALLNNKSIILKYAYAPRYGFGFNLQAGANSSILSGLLPTNFTPGAASVPANNVQICGNGVAAPGIATCIPYLQGYAQGTLTTPGGTFVGLGGLFLGKNNSYFQPPFWQVDFVARQAVSPNVEVQVSVQNLLNMNNYGAYLPIPGAGTPIVANTTNAAFSSISQTSFTPSLVTAPPRTVRLQVRLHVGP